MTRRRPRFADSIEAEDHYSAVIAAWQVIGGVAVIAGVMLGAYCGGRIQAGVDEHNPTIIYKLVGSHYICDPPKRLWNPDTGEQIRELVCDQQLAPPVIEPTPGPDSNIEWSVK